MLDANVGALVRRLEAQGTLDNTYVVFTSDNGYNMGEHRLDIAKYNQFEETVSVPLLVRGPGIEAGTHISELAGNIDLAPTIADMANIPAPDRVDGLSLLPLLNAGETTLPREHLLLSRGLIPLEKEALSAVEEFPETVVESPRHARLSDFNAVVTKRWKLVDYINSDHEELYDLRNDPLRAHQPDGRWLAVAEVHAALAAGPGPRPAQDAAQAAQVRSGRLPPVTLHRMTFRVGFVTGATPDKWARVWGERSKERLELVPVEQDVQLDGVRDGTLSMALVRLPVDRDGLHLIPLYDEQPVAC